MRSTAERAIEPLAEARVQENLTEAGITKSGVLLPCLVVPRFGPPSAVNRQAPDLSQVTAASMSAANVDRSG